MAWEDEERKAWREDREKLCSQCIRRGTHCSSCDEGDEFYPPFSL